jgi:hypothetical protein
MVVTADAMGFAACLQGVRYSPSTAFTWGPLYHQIAVAVAAMAKMPALCHFLT